MIHEATLAALIREEAGYAVAAHDIATLIMEVLHGYTRGASHFKYKVADRFRELVPEGWVVAQRGNVLRFYHPKLLPFERRVEIELTVDAEENLNHMDIMVRQLGKHFMGKSCAQGMMSLLPKLPELIHSHSIAQRRLEDALLAFGPAAHLIPPLLPKSSVS